MAPPKIITVGGLAAANPALLAASQTPVSGTALTLTGTQPDKARRVLLTYGSEGGARTLTIYGTNAYGNVISEILAVPSGAGGTVASNLDYKTVTSAMPLGGGWTAAVTLGTNGVASSTWKVVNVFQQGQASSFLVTQTGTLNWSLQYTLDDPNNGQGNSNVPPIAQSFPGMNAQSAGPMPFQTLEPFFAWRMLINSGTGTAIAQLIQAGARD